MWTTVLETPTPQNPFADGDPCVPLDHHVVVPIARGGVDSCTVKSGTKIFVTAWANECSTFEGNGTTEAEPRACAVRADADITSTPTVVVDGQSLPVTEVQTGLLSIRLPRDNFFAEKAADRNGLSVAHGWVVLLQPLAAGKHRIHIYV
ncbi:MAG: hypothetical protein WCG47_19085, partial [Dermatophilaceae bacterium]